MQTRAVVLNAPRSLAIESLDLKTPDADDIVVEIAHSGISTGTEKLFWTGEMPPFPGMGYPLVPGYEAMGEVVEAGANVDLRPGDTVFVPGANCYDGAFGLFGAAAACLVSDASRVTKVDRQMEAEGALLALAATALHAIAGPQKSAPELIVGHGTLGRLLARLTIATGAPPPTVWELDPGRMSGAAGYDVMRPEDDPRRDYGSIYDASGSGAILDDLVKRIARGGEIVLAGFYTAPPPPPPPVLGLSARLHEGSAAAHFGGMDARRSDRDPRADRRWRTQP